MERISHTVFLKRFQEATKQIKENVMSPLLAKVHWKVKRQWDLIRYAAEHKAQLSSLMNASGHFHKDILLYPPTIDWNIPLFQRPQHLALQLSKLGYLFFFASPNYQDRVNGFRRINENLYITNRHDLLLSKPFEKWILINSTNRDIVYKTLLKYKALGFRIIYDYIDEITPEISPIEISLDRHRRLNARDVDLVIATAGSLYDEMLQRFPLNKVLYIPNAVDYSHFHKIRTDKKCPHDLEPVVSEGKPIIGYYGALAKWIDYSLLDYISKKRKDWNIVLIGPDYDGSANKMIKRNNVKYLGIKKYNDLPDYAVWFDVAMIPFSEGQIARSTSPLKLFEYMAMNKPVVTTKDLIECHKYEGILVAENYNDFLSKIEEGLELKDDKQYIKQIDLQAKQNTWEQRAKEIDKWMDQDKSKTSTG
jgi:glycosyltransferase involved in cell wall biosynthesis